MSDRSRGRAEMAAAVNARRTKAARWSSGWRRLTQRTAPAPTELAALVAQALGIEFA